VITFAGTSFPDKTLFTAKAIFKSSETAVSDWSSTDLIATFANGVPAADVAESAVAKIVFTRNTDSVQFATYSTNVFLSNTVTASPADSTAGLQSSFAGGLSYTITKNNLFASLKEPGNSVTICGNVC